MQLRDLMPPRTPAEDLLKANVTLLEEFITAHQELGTHWQTLLNEYIGFASSCIEADQQGNLFAYFYFADKTQQHYDLILKRLESSSTEQFLELQETLLQLQGQLNFRNKQARNVLIQAIWKDPAGVLPLVQQFIEELYALPYWDAELLTPVATRLMSIVVEITTALHKDTLAQLMDVDEEEIDTVQQARLVEHMPQIARQSLLIFGLKLADHALRGEDRLKIGIYTATNDEVFKLAEELLAALYDKERFEVLRKYFNGEIYIRTMFEVSEGKPAPADFSALFSTPVTPYLFSSFYTVWIALMIYGSAWREYLPHL